MEPKTKFNLFNFRKNKCCYGQIWCRLDIYGGRTTCTCRECVLFFRSSPAAQSYYFGIVGPAPAPVPALDTVLRKNKQPQKDVKDVQGAGLFVCLFVCTRNALLWHRHCTLHWHSHFPFNVSLQQIRFVYLFLFSILTRKTKQKKNLPWATLCDCCEPLLESIKNEQLHVSRCLAIFDHPKETFWHVWLPSLFSALPL